MNIKYKGLNLDETYCCTKKEIDTVFKGEDISIFFGVINLSRNEEVNNKKYRPNKSCNDRILIRMCVRKSRIDKFGLPCNSTLRIFIIKKIGYTDELHTEFITEVLPKIKKLFDEHKDDDFNINHGDYVLTIGLNGHRFNFYESFTFKH